MRDILDEMRGNYGLVTSLVFATACEGVGADLQIRATTATRIEVFLGHEKCRGSNDAPCAPGVGWSKDVAPPPGDIYLLADETPLHAIPKGDYWDVQLQAQPDYRQLVIGIAGYDDTNNVVEAAVLRDVEIPMNSAQTWDVTLLPVTKLTGGGAPTVDVPRARAWAHDTRLPACFAYQHAGADAAFTDYFVPRTDPDCDGELAPVDCVPYWADKLDGTQGQLCSQKAGPDMPNVCTLGRTGCSGSTSCTQTDGKTTCVPEAVCATCGDEPLAGCVSGSFGDPQLLATVPHASCRFVNAQGQYCTQGFMRLQIPSLGASCTGANLRKVATPFADGNPSETTSWGSTVTVAIGANTPPGGGCLLSVSMSGPTLVTSPGYEVFVLVVSYDNGRSITLPLEVEVGVDACTGYSSECQMHEVMADPLLTCTAP